MKKTKNILFIVVLFLVLTSSYAQIAQAENNYKLITTTKNFIAGTNVSISFTSNNTLNSPSLYIKSAYSRTLLSPIIKNNITFNIPDVFSKKAGIINWSLILNGEIIAKNYIEIIPNVPTKNLVETYLGPRSIQAGNRDYTMLVIIPTDKFDNPLPQNSAVKSHVQFLDNIEYTELKTNNLIAWQNITSREKSGALHISSSSNNTTTNELTTVIFPSNPINFLIHANSSHNFADGNELTELITSEIKDEFGNIISDGTLVEFNIRNSKNIVLKTRSSTLNGIAKAKILHPDHKDLWRIKGYVNGLAESNTIQLAFKAIIDDFDVTFSEENRKITVGPLLSFMDQLIPDGALVKLHIYSKNKLVETKSSTSFKGFVKFYISSEFYKEDSYSFKIKALGVSKNIDQINYAKLNK
ncbi:hypothetical protein [Lutibacter citreus]|uniref:hypothetical protein n=1 Tax=Lutibacter citreus TaxID=2138210 RepID=UPI000DBE8B01|nr:hypothetical protein [Lutibacter citreus]